MVQNRFPGKVETCAIVNNISWEFKKKKKNFGKGEKPNGAEAQRGLDWRCVDSCLQWEMSCGLTADPLGSRFRCCFCLCCSSLVSLRMRINEEAPARVTMTASFNIHHQRAGTSANPLCGTTAVRLGLRGGRMWTRGHLLWWT